MGRPNICVICGKVIPKGRRYLDTCDAQCQKKAQAADTVNLEWW